MPDIMSMAERNVSWREPASDQVRCARCLELKDGLEVDRLLWCEDCKRRARSRAASWGWVGGAVFGAVVSAYVWFVVHPSLMIAGWLATIAAAIWIGGRLCREIIYGGMRFLNTRGVEAGTHEAKPRD